MRHARLNTQRKILEAMWLSGCDAGPLIRTDFSQQQQPLPFLELKAARHLEASSDEADLR